MTMRTFPLLVAAGALALAACADAPTAADAAPTAADGAWLAASSEGNALLARARGATARYHDVEAAMADGYVSTFECVAIPGGAMGVHYVKPPLLMDAVSVVEQPEALVYEPQKNGSFKLVAVEYIILEGPWRGANPTGAPSLFGEDFEFGPGPLGPWYTLHAWTWRHNPDGMFAPFNPKASCDAAGASSAVGHQH